MLSRLRKARLPPALTLRKPTDLSRCSCLALRVLIRRVKSRAQGELPSGHRPPQTHALAPDTAVEALGVQCPHFTNRHTEARRGEARCQGYAAEQARDAGPSRLEMGLDASPWGALLRQEGRVGRRPEEETPPCSGGGGVLFFAPSALSAWHGASPRMSLLGPGPAQVPISLSPVWAPGVGDPQVLVAMATS